VCIIVFFMVPRYIDFIEIRLKTICPVFVDGSPHSGVAYCYTNSVYCSNVASSTFRTGRVNPFEVRFIRSHVSMRCFDWFGCIDSTAYARLDCARL